MYRKLPHVKIVKPRQPSALPPAALKPQDDRGDNAEVLTGKVQGLDASASEERLGKALARSVRIQGFEFRHTLGAPRGLPGWKEVDYLVSFGGLVYPIEVDTVFTHRKKKEADRLHDAIVLSELGKLGINAYPQVIHLSGDTELADQKNADAAVKRMFG